MSILDASIKDTFGIKPVKKDIGIEIELEFSPRADIPQIVGGGWNTVADGSLRHGMEYKFSEPANIKDLDSRMTPFRSMVKEYGQHMVTSPRTSVHFHLNMSNKTVGNLLSVYNGYLLYENLFFASQMGRKSNLFCLRTMDAEGLYNRILSGIRGIRTTPFAAHMPADERYSGINLCSLRRFGSVEYRFMSGTTDADVITTWGRGLHHLHQACEDIAPLDQVELAKMGWREMNAKMLTPELSSLLDPYVDKLDGNEYGAGIQYASTLATMIDAARSIKPPVVRPNYIFNPNPDIEPVKSKKKKVSPFEAMVIAHVEDRAGLDLDAGVLNAAGNMWINAMGEPVPAPRGDVPAGAPENYHADWRRGWRR